MKRMFARLTAIIWILSLSAAIAGTVKIPPICQASDLLSSASVYCNRWDRLIGKSVGYDMAFDETNVRKIADKHSDMGGNEVTAFDFDGIWLDVDDDQTVYAVTIPVEPGTEGQYASTARIFAVISAMAYDFPDSEKEMTARYMNLMDEYLDFMEQNKETLADGSFAYWKITTGKGEFTFQFIYISGKLRMMYDELYFE